MTAEEIAATTEAEVGNDWSLAGGEPLSLWIVLEETPGKRDGYLIVFDEQRRTFGPADWSGDTPVFLGYHGGFLNTLQGM